MSRLGATYHKLREYEQAITYYENGLEKLREVLKNDDPQPIIFETYHGLAHAYHDNATELIKRQQAGTSDPPAVAVEQLAKAEDYYKKAVNYQKGIKSNNPLVTLTSLKNLAQLYLDIGRYEDAEQSLKSVVDLYNTVEYHPGEGREDALKELGDFYRNRARFEDAARTYTTLIDLYENNANFYHLEPSRIRELADDYSELGQIYIAMKDEQRGEAAFDLVKTIQGLQLKLKRKGPLQVTDPASSFDDDLDQLGDLYIKLGRVAQAQRSYATALEIREGVKAENDSLAFSYLKLGNLYRDEYHNYQKAEEYYTKLIENRKGVKGGFGGTRDPEEQYLNGLRQLAILYTENLNKPADAEVLLNRALTVLMGGNPRSNWKPEVEIYSELVSLYQKQKKSPQEIQSLRVRNFDMMIKRRDTFLPVGRMSTDRKFIAAFARMAGEIADYYISQNNKTAAEATYAQVFDAINATTHMLPYDDDELDNYLTNLEKYQALLREHNDTVKAAQWDKVVKDGRALQKELEDRQKESQPPVKP